MSPNNTRRAPIDAGTLLERLAHDEDYQQRMVDQERFWEQRVARNTRDEAPVI